jgi:hypothetical protein
MSPKDLKEYLKVCREYGVARLVIEGTEVTLDLSHPGPLSRKEREAAKESKPADPSYEKLSEEEIALWSAIGA